MSHSDKTNNYAEFYYHFFRNILLVGIPLVIISAIVLSSLHSSATSSSSGSGTDSLTISISSACTLSSTVNTEHSDDVKAGTYKDNIGKTTIKTTCNDNNGYSIYANGYSNNEEGNNRLINTLSSSNVIETGLNTSGDISSWAMKLNNLPDDPSPTPPVIESAYDDTYGPIPSNWTKVLSLSSGSTDMSLGSSFTTTYAVYANSRQYTGTYQGQVKYVLTHPNINKPTLNSLELAFISHGRQIAYQDEYGSYFAMQDMTTDICNSVSGNGDSTAIQLVDIRDNKLYWVTKLKDEHCWMTQNLDFYITANTTLNSNTTDLNVAYDSSTGQYAEYNDGYTKSNGVIYYAPASTATTIDFTGTTVTGWQKSDTAPYTANKTDSPETGHTSLGNYYNWTAAISSNNSSTLTQNTFSDISKNPKNSVCPKGWRLPTISNQSEALPGSTNEFERLKSLYNDMLAAPLFFNKSGFISNASISDLYISGTYLSSSSYSSIAIWGASLKNNELKTDWWNNDYSGRRGGHSIRCIAR